MNLYQLEVNLSRSDIISVGEVGNVEDLAALLSCEQLNQAHKLDVLEGEREDCLMVREIKSIQAKLELDLVLLLEEVSWR